MKQRKPRLEKDRIPYAIVSVDKLIEIAERIVVLEEQVKQLINFSHGVKTQIIEAIAPHISDMRDGKIFIRSIAENGEIYRAEVQIVGEITIDRDH